MILSNSPPLSQGKFTKTSDIGLFSSLNNRISLFNIKTGKLIKEYHGHENNEYLVDVMMSYDAHGDIDGFFTGSENGKLYRFNIAQETPADSLTVNTEGLTVDLLLQQNRGLLVSGRGWSSVYKVSY